MKFVFLFFACSLAHAGFTLEKPLKWAVLSENKNQDTVQILGQEISGNYVLWTQGHVGGAVGIGSAVIYQNRCGIEVGGEVTASFVYPFLVTASTVCRVNEDEKAWVKVQDLPKAENPFSIAYLGTFSTAQSNGGASNAALAVQSASLVFLYNWAPFPDENDEGGSLSAIVVPANASAKTASVRVKTILNHIPGYSGALRLNRATNKMGITLSDGSSLNQLASIDVNILIQLTRSNRLVDWQSLSASGVSFKGMSLTLDFSDEGFVLGQEKAKTVIAQDGKIRGIVTYRCSWLGIVSNSVYELCDGKTIVKTSLKSRLAPGPLL